MRQLGGPSSVLLALSLAGCFYFEPIAPSRSSSADADLLPCELPPEAEGAPDDCPGLGATESDLSIEGDYSGGFCIYADATWRGTRLLDVCEGIFDVSYDASALPPLDGDGSCSFVGRVLSLSIRDLLPDTYGGSLDGEWNEADSTFGGLLHLETGVGPIESPWSGEICEAGLIGRIEGSTSIKWEGDPIDIEFDGIFAGIHR